MFCLVIVSIQVHSKLSERRNSKFPSLKSFLVVVEWGGGGLSDYSVKPGPDLSRLRLRLVTRSIKARFGQVDDQVKQVKDQVGQGQGQGQELDNCSICKTLLVHFHLLYCIPCRKKPY